MEDFGVGLQHCKQKKELIDEEEGWGCSYNVLIQISRAQVKYRESMYRSESERRYKNYFSVCVCSVASDSLYTRLFIVLHVQDLFPAHGTNPLLVCTSCNTWKKSHRYTNTASVPRLCERKEVEYGAYLGSSESPPGALSACISYTW